LTAADGLRYRNLLLDGGFPLHPGLRAAQLDDGRHQDIGSQEEKSEDEEGGKQVHVTYLPWLTTK
jgi:hypothetical protein